MTCDIVIRNGHVVDPATGTDGVRTIGILGNRIVEGAEAGKASVSEVDAAGCYVFPVLWTTTPICFTAPANSVSNRRPAFPSA